MTREQAEELSKLTNFSVEEIMKISEVVRNDINNSNWSKEDKQSWKEMGYRSNPEKY